MCGTSEQRCCRRGLPAEGEWSEWSEFGACSKPCEGGIMNRTRTCTTLPDRPCFGEENETASCNEDICPGEWTDWSEWEPCSVTCGGGNTTRNRTCQSTTEKNNLCEGPETEVQSCNEEVCPGIWSEWDNWTQCSATCGEATQTRNRTCTTENEGRPCIGEKGESRYCNNTVCPDVWGSWTEFSPCTVSCGNGTQSRSRNCTEGICTVPVETETQFCNTDPCPEWTEYGEWSSCSEECGPGLEKRERQCLDHKEQVSTGCNGNATEERPCEVRPCYDTECGVPKPNTRILNGGPVDNCQYSWMASIEMHISGNEKNFYKAICSGVFVDGTKILTTAKCAALVGAFEVKKQELTSYGLTVELSVVYQVDRGQSKKKSIQAEDFELHDSFSPDTTNIENSFMLNNVAILNLGEDLTNGTCIRRVCLPGMGRVVEKDACVIAGFGVSQDLATPDLSQSPVLLSSSVTLMDQHVCEEILAYTNPHAASVTSQDFHDQFICTDTMKDETSSCPGDQGGMMICPDTNGRWTLEGLISDSRCDKKSPDVYVNVTSQAEWIREKIPKHDFTPS